MVKKIGYVVITSGTLAGLALYVWLHRDEVGSIALVSPAALGLCAGAMLGSLLAAGPLFYLMINKLQRCVGLLECVSLSILTTAVNTVVPFQGGAGVRAMYLKQRHGLNYCDFLATLYGYQVLRVLLCTFGAAVSVLWMALGENREGLAPIAAGVLLCLAVAVAACCLPRVPATRHWLVNRLAAFTQGWHTLRAEPRLLASMVGLVALQLAVEVLSFWAACATIGAPLGAAEAIAISSLGIVTSIVGLTPSGLGLYEAMVAFASSAVALNPVSNVMAALIMRLVLLAVLAILTPLSICQLSRGWNRPAAPLPQSI